ncbi:MAG TPA: T9SS type A sorting domain-containing protein, partial [Chitinophagaceae bacterium]|nr:T9SS type A sorting domain-containing protein [Chitinophagaceae bacterium]
SGFYRVCLTAVTANNCKKVYCENIFIPQGGNGRANITSNIPVYPNPATNAVRLEVKMDGANMIRFRVMDGSGVQKMEFTRQGQHGLNYIQIPVERLGSGQYLVEIRYGNQLKLAKFQKS